MTPHVASHGSDVVAEPVNEKPQQAGTCWGVFVDLPADLLVLSLTAQTSLPAPPSRCMDGIDILQRRP